MKEATGELLANYAAGGVPDGDDVQATVRAARDFLAAARQVLGLTG